MGMEVKTKACEELLQDRVQHKFKSKKVETIMNRLSVAVPEPRDNKSRPAFIPEAALRKRRRKWRKVWQKMKKKWKPLFLDVKLSVKLNWKWEMITLWIFRRTLIFHLIRNMMLYQRLGRDTILLTLLILTSWRSWRLWRRKRRLENELVTMTRTNLRRMKVMRKLKNLQRRLDTRRQL